jgi:hypothetical protein
MIKTSRKNPENIPDAFLMVDSGNTKHLTIFKINVKGQNMSINVKMASRFKLAENVVSKSVDNDLIVLNLEDGTYFMLNPTGAFIWQKFSEGFTIGEVAERIMSKYDVSLDVAKQDTISLTKSFTDNRLLVVRGV